MRLHSLEHVPFEGPAAIAIYARKKGFVLDQTRLWAGDSLPNLARMDLLFVMGGPMSVYDVERHPWLASEKAFLRAAVESGVWVLGICLGAQLLAEALGGVVTRNTHREIGWHAVTLTPEAGHAPVISGFPQSFPAFHWHGDTFSIPDCATRLAFSEACANQAFAVDSQCVGLQFHLETTQESMALLMEHCVHELAPGRFVHSPEQMRADVGQIDATHALLALLINNMIQEQ